MAKLLVVIMFAIFAVTLISAGDPLIAKVFQHYCKDNLSLKNRVEYNKCEDLIPTEAMEAIRDCAKNGHHLKTLEKPTVCYLSDNSPDNKDAVDCQIKYYKDHQISSEVSEYYFNKWEECFKKLSLE